jgi:cytoskeletal protein RodZ
VSVRVEQGPPPGADDAARGGEAGAWLARGRAHEGLEIDEVSRRTYIRVGVLRRMEENDFTACGGDCYARGQLRILAAVLKLDEKELLAAYGGKDAVEDRALVEDTVPAQHRRPGPLRRGVSLGVLMLVLATGLVAAMLAL